MREVNDEFGEAGLQILDGVEIKVLPFAGLNGWVGNGDRIEDASFGESRAFISGGVFGSMAARNGSLYS